MMNLQELLMLRIRRGVKGHTLSQTMIKGNYIARAITRNGRKWRWKNGGMYGLYGAHVVNIGCV